MNFSRTVFRLTPIFCLFTFCLWFTACGRQEKADAPQPTSNATVALKQQVFDVKGEVKEVKLDEKTVVIKHEEIRDYMKAMTMPFEVRDTNEIAGLKPGDSISFKLFTTDTDAWIANVKKLGEVAASSDDDDSFRRIPDFEPLAEGSALPDYLFTNELGQAVQFSAWKGKGVAITFIFTTCPFPTFCPRMTQNFVEVQRLMSAGASVTNWLLASMSFDPKKDSPAVMLNYGRGFKYNPDHWTFLSGDPVTIAMFAGQVGQFYYEKDNTINHNLRTLVINANGTIRKIIPDNKWTPEELATDLKAACETR